MIILYCKYCSSKNLKPNASYPEAVCNNCDRILQLWEIRPVYFQDGHVVNVTEVPELYTTQIGLK